MEIVVIEGKTFEQLKRHFDDFTKQIKILCGGGRNTEKWMKQCGSLQPSANLSTDVAIVQGRRNFVVFPNRTQVLLQDFGHRNIVEPIKKRISMKEEKYFDFPYWSAIGKT